MIFIISAYIINMEAKLKVEIQGLEAFVMAEKQECEDCPLIKT
jgi:hypothetical protein